ncbi:hypothetical protein L1987_87300 [Smallanthus sonchifolius]|nr:hypothetical protein L1987_87300 [Smallanthus sonchifolius]
MGINSNRVEHYSDPGHADQLHADITATAPVTITVSGETMTVHNVCLPPQKSTLQKLRHRLSEIFFPDDPLHGFKNQSRLRKLVLALQFFFPIFEWAPNYNFTLLRSDVVSGLTIASLAIPQGISYAKLANLPPIIGLYSSFVPPLIYSVLGSSKHLAVGPVSIASLVMGTMLTEAVPYNQHPGMKKPKLFWVSAAAPLASVILSTLLVTLFRSKLHGIATIGHLEKGLNPPSSNMLYFHGQFLGVAIKTGIITGILSLTEGIAFSRSAVNANAGAKTVVSNVVMASTVLVTLLFLMPLFHYTPNLILAAIIITAVIGLIDYQSAVRLWKVDKLDFLACLSSFLGVLMISVPIGLAIAVGVSVFKILLHVTRPNTGVLGNIPGTQIYQNVNRYREAKRVPSFVILGIEAPIYFANSTYLQERILRWIREEEEWLAANNGSSSKCVIIDMTAVTGIDTSGLAMMKELKKMLEKRSLQVRKRGCKPSESVLNA